jgi:hypothetical protein
MFTIFYNKTTVPSFTDFILTELFSYLGVEGKAIPVTDYGDLTGLWKVEAPTFSRKSAHRWR